MNKRTFQRWFVVAIIIFTLLLISGIVISAIDQTQDRIIFSTFKDLLPIILGITAIWLGYCVQSRNAYQQQLRSLWTNLVEAVHYALQYTQMEKPNEEQYRLVLTKLSIAIDETRSLFCNINEGETEKGLYPFEPLKNIYFQIEGLSFGTKFKQKKSIICHKQIFALWQDVRKEILKEFDREPPSFPHSHWADLSKGQVYEQFHIEKKST